MVVASFNAASVRARLPILLNWLESRDPDVLAIQETKVEDDKFPIAEFEELGYFGYLHGQKSWNGVCLLSKRPMNNVRHGFPDPSMPVDARIIYGELDGVSIINTYVPNGNTVGSEKWEYKMLWLEKFAEFLRQNFDPQKPVVWLGDINIAPQPIDVYDSPKLLGGVGHHPDEFARLEQIRAFGLTDLFRHFEPDTQEYTFWDFTIPQAVARKKGWRIDHIYVTQALLGSAKRCWIDLEPRKWERPSDHTFVIAEL